MITQKDFFKNLVANRERNLAKVQNIDEFARTLQRFDDLKKDTIYENHSIKKEIPGSSPKFSPEKVSFANKKYFETLINDSSRLKFVAKRKSKRTPLPH